MNDDTIADLKQFIAATISQQTTDLREDMSEMKADLHVVKDGLVLVNKKVDNLSNAVGEALDTSNTATDQQLKDHEQRIVQLEQKPA